MKHFIYLYLSLLLLTSCGTQQRSHPLKDFKYPFPVKYLSLESQQQKLSMAYMDLNEESKKVIVLLHGKNFAAYYWERIAKDLSQRGYRVIIPDQIGFGKSSFPKNYDYSFAQLAHNTHQLLSQLKITDYSIVGHSMGGMLAIHYTLLFNKEVNKLALINPIGLEDYGRYSEFKEPNFFFAIERNKDIEQIRNYQKKNYYDGKWNSEYEGIIAHHKKFLRSNSYDNDSL